MQHSPEPTPLPVAIEQFFNAKRAEKLSPNTIRDYTLTLRRFLDFIGDKPIHLITPNQVRSFLASLELSKKTVLNAHICLSSLWTWAVNDGLCIEHIIRKVVPPEPEKRKIEPLSREDVEKLFQYVGRPAARNRAALLLLLDTGIRASELSALTLGDLRGSCIHIFGKGDKERLVPMSETTLRALLDYLTTRKRAGLKSPLFTSSLAEKPTNRHALRKWLGRLGQRAGVPKVHPHRFRHTFAVNYLRNGGDAISLQKLLGHSTLDMVRNYIDLAADDLVAIHRRASPVENWSLRKILHQGNHEPSVP